MHESVVKVIHKRWQGWRWEWLDIRHIDDEPLFVRFLGWLARLAGIGVLHASDRGHHNFDVAAAGNVQQGID